MLYISQPATEIMDEIMRLNNTTLEIRNYVEFVNRKAKCLQSCFKNREYILLEITCWNETDYKSALLQYKKFWELPEGFKQLRDNNKFQKDNIIVTVYTAEEFGGVEFELLGHGIFVLPRNEVDSKTQEVRKYVLLDCLFIR